MCQKDLIFRVPLINWTWNMHKVEKWDSFFFFFFLLNGCVLNFGIRELGCIVEVFKTFHFGIAGDLWII